MSARRIGVTVRSLQVNDDSLPLASLGSSTFLDYLLGNMAKAFPDEPKIFAMEFGDLQRLSGALVDRVKSHGFEMFIGTHPYVPRLLAAAKRYELDDIVDVRVDAPLTIGSVARGMLDAHRAGGQELTLCQNLPLTLAPTVVSRGALSRWHAMTATGFGGAYGVNGNGAVRNYYAAMLQQPGRYTAGFYEAPIRWEGTIDLFAEESARMWLDSPAALSRLRQAVYHINKDELTVDDVIDFLLIRNMRTAWDQPTAFDSKFVVADQAGWDKPGAYEEAAEAETRWFVLDDARFLEGIEPQRSSILEVGCGHGRLCRVLAAHFCQVHGTDASLERYSEARYRCRPFGNIRITQNDGRSLSQYPGQLVDRAFAHGVFVHINSRTVIENYVKEMARVLKPGGRLKFDAYFGRDTFGISTQQFGLGARFTEEEIRGMLGAAGLTEVAIDHVNTRQYSRVGPDYSLELAQVLVTAEKPRG